MWWTRYNEFINFFTNFFHEFFSVWTVEKENKLLIGPKQFFFLSLPVEKEIIITIRWKKSLIRNLRLVKLSDEFVNNCDENDKKISHISIIFTWHWSFPNQSQFSNRLLNLDHFLLKLIHPELDNYCHILCHILVHLVV